MKSILTRIRVALFVDDNEDIVNTTGTNNEPDMVEEQKAKEAPTTKQSVDMQPPPVKEHTVESHIPLIITTTQKEQTEMGKEKPEKKLEEKKDEEKKTKEKKKTLIDDDDDDEDSASIKGPRVMDNLSAS